MVSWTRRRSRAEIDALDADRLEAARQPLEVLLFEVRLAAVDAHHLVDRVAEEEAAIQGGDLDVVERHELTVQVGQAVHRKLLDAWRASRRKPDVHVALMPRRSPVWKHQFNGFNITSRKWISAPSDCSRILPLVSSASVPSLTSWPLITSLIVSPLQVISYWFHSPRSSRRRPSCGSSGGPPSGPAAWDRP